jgi:hypothetical protein
MTVFGSAPRPPELFPVFQTARQHQEVIAQDILFEHIG